MSSPPRSADPHQEARELLRRVVAKDAAAFAALHDEFAGVLLATAVTVLKSAEEAEDVLQEVFLTVWRKAGMYDPALGSPVSWLLALTRNKAYDRYRSLRRSSEARARRGDELRERLIAQLTRHWGGTKVDELAALQVALDQLSAEQREAIEAVYVDGLTQQEAAELLEEPLGTIKARVRRGLARLRGLLPWGSPGGSREEGDQS